MTQNNDGGLESRIQADRDAAATDLWNDYFERLVRLAHQRMTATTRRVTGAEDVALSAIKSFIRGIEAGRFPDLSDEENIWRLLAKLTFRKARARHREHHTQKRGGGNTRGDSVALPAEEAGAAGFDCFASDEPTPEMAAIMNETCDEMLNRLDAEQMRQIALLKLEGFSNDEVADRVDCSTRTVERKLNHIRQIWSDGEQ